LDDLRRLRDIGGTRELATRRMAAAKSWFIDLILVGSGYRMRSAKADFTSALAWGAEHG
jgi:hypothetical protein